MTQAYLVRRADGWGAAAARGLARRLPLAGTPAFATLAAVSGLDGAGPMHALCASGPAAPLSGMTTMYLLMSVFHATPWLKLILARGEAPRRSA